MEEDEKADDVKKESIVIFGFVVLMSGLIIAPEVCASETSHIDASAREVRV